MSCSITARISPASTYLNGLTGETVSTFTASRSIRLESRFDTVLADLDTAIPLGLILHELLTDAARVEARSHARRFAHEPDEGNAGEEESERSVGFGPCRVDHAAADEVMLGGAATSKPEFNMANLTRRVLPSRLRIGPRMQTPRPNTPASIPSR